MANGTTLSQLARDMSIFTGEDAFDMFQRQWLDCVKCMTAEDFANYILDEPIWPDGVEFWKVIRFAAIVRAVYVDKFGPTFWSGDHWFEDRKYVSKTPILPAGGRIANLNAYYLTNSLPATRPHNVYLLRNDLVRV